MAELSLWLDTYDDIYSDFDSRHYVRRRISEDFLHELRMELKYRKDHSPDLVLLLPQEVRQENEERVIADSLNDFFTLRYHYHKEKCNQKMNNVVILFISGIVVILLNSWISYKAGASFLIIGLRILLEPAGWFLFWAAFDFLFYDFFDLKKEREFYKTLSEMHVHFKPS